MKKCLTFLLPFSFAALICAAEKNSALPRQPSPAGAEVYIASLDDGAVVGKKVNVVFGLRGMGICPAGIVGKDGNPIPNTGHHHLLIDACSLPPMDSPLVASDSLKHFGLGQTETTLELAPGKHTLQLIFADFAHIPHNPPVVSKKVTTTVK